MGLPRESGIATEIRTTIYNLDSNEYIYLQIEPEIIPGNIAANYNSDPALAGTHENLMFSHTSNENFTLELRWNTYMGVTSDQIEDDRKFIRSLVNPRSFSDVIGGDPPLLQVTVPGVFDVRARLTNIDWDVAARSPVNGKIVKLTMRCTFREDPVYRYSSDEIRTKGYDRG